MMQDLRVEKRKEMTEIKNKLTLNKKTPRS